MFPILDVGTYRVAVTASGFTRCERRDLVLSSNQVLNVGARLEPATTATVTEVRGTMAVISTETSSLTDVKTNEVIEQLPLQMSRHVADKGFYTYTFLNTGVSSVTYTSLPVINGVRDESGVLPTMDGIAVTAYSGGASPVQPSLEGVQEVNVVTNNPPAEFAVAADYTVVTKSGTNELHGSAFYNYNSNSGGTTLRESGQDLGTPTSFWGFRRLPNWLFHSRRATSVPERQVCTIRTSSRSIAS